VERGIKTFLLIATILKIAYIFTVDFVTGYEVTVEVSAVL